MRMLQANLPILAMGSVLILSVGCSALRPNVVPGDPGQSAEATARTEIKLSNMGKPAQMAAIWRQNVLKTGGQKPVRGVTGRFYFYDAQDQLLEVDGELTVYGYDDSNYQNSEVPDHVYKFPPEHFKKHYNASELGHSYAVWLPWPQEDVYRKSISLVPVFKTSDGHMIQGRMGSLALSGMAPPHNNGVEKTVVKQPAANKQTIIGDSPTAANRQIDTLEVPYSLARRLANQPIQQVPQARAASPEVLQHLTDMESNELNPNGERYNQTSFVTTQSQVKPPADSNERTESTNTHNFSDLRQLSNPSRNQRPPEQPSFGRPGKIR